MKICLHSTGKETKFLLAVEWASLVAQLVNNLPAMQETPVQLLGWEDPLEKIQAQYSWASLAAQLIKKKKTPTIRETWVQSLGWEDPLEKLPTPAFALLHSVLQSQTCRLSQVSFNFLFLHFSSLWWCWRRKWQPTLVFLPGEFHGQRTLAGCSP